jgi:hypothetical protein
LGRGVPDPERIEDDRGWQIRGLRDLCELAPQVSVKVCAFDLSHDSVKMFDPSPIPRILARHAVDLAGFDCDARRKKSSLSRVYLDGARAVHLADGSSPKESAGAARAFFGLEGSIPVEDP